MKARPQASGGERVGVAFWCAGCGQAHSVPLTGPVKWEWDGDTEQPTIHPSVKITAVVGIDENNQDIKDICHSVVTKGMIRFVDDSTHKLSGQTVPLEDW